MCWRIEKTYSFEASHQLVGLPEGHKCGRDHGHSYKLTVAIASNELQPEGWVKDFGELAPLKHHIDENFDHRNLNEVLAKLVPSLTPSGSTSENLAWYFFQWCREFIDLPRNATILWTRISETESSSATYYK